MFSIVVFIARKSCNNLHFPDFFLMTKMGVFQGLLEGSIWPAASCSITKSSAACSFPAVKGHYTTHNGSSDFQVIGLAARATASRINLNILQFSSVQFSRSVKSDSLRPHESQHIRPPCPSPTPGVHSDSRPSSR